MALAADWGVGRTYSVAEMRRQECTRGGDEMGHSAKAGENAVGKWSFPTCWSPECVERCEGGQAEMVRVRM